MSNVEKVIRDLNLNKDLIKEVKDTTIEKIEKYVFKRKSIIKTSNGEKETMIKIFPYIKLDDGSYKQTHNSYHKIEIYTKEFVSQ